jgi:hypothetical protein
MDLGKVKRKINIPHREDAPVQPRRIEREAPALPSEPAAPQRQRELEPAR